MPSERLSKVEAGALIRQRREAQGLTQEQVAERAGIPTITQLSEYEAGKVGFATGKHFPGIIRALALSADDIEAINPAYVVRTEPTPRRLGPPVPPVIPFRETPISIPRELLEMVEKHGDAYPVLKTTQMQQMLAAPRNFGGAEVGPQTAEDWFDYWMANKRFLT